MQHKTIILLIFVAIAFATTIIGSEKEQADNQKKQKLSEQQAWDIYYKFIEDEKPYGIPVKIEDHIKGIKPSIRYFDDLSVFYMTAPTYEIGRGGFFTIDIDACTGELRGYQNNHAISLLDRSDEIKPKYSEEKVKKIGLNFLKYNKNIQMKEYMLIVEFEKNYWSIFFRRKLNGFSFEDDAISIEYSEKYGLIFYSNSIFSDECDTEIKITEDQARSLVHEYLKKYQLETGSKTKMELIEEPETVIVNPAYIVTRPSIEDTPLSELRKTRLAWRILFMGPKSQGDFREAVQFYIDAIDGKLLHIMVIN